MPAAARQDMESILDASWMDGAKAFRVIVKPCSKTFSSLVLRHGSLLGLWTTMMTRPRFFSFLHWGNLHWSFGGMGGHWQTLLRLRQRGHVFFPHLHWGSLHFSTDHLEARESTGYGYYGSGDKDKSFSLALALLAFVLDLNFVEFMGVVPVKPAFLLKLASHGKFLRLNPKQQVSSFIGVSWIFLEGWRNVPSCFNSYAVSSWLLAFMSPSYLIVIGQKDGLRRLPLKPGRFCVS